MVFVMELRLEVLVPVVVFCFKSFSNACVLWKIWQIPNKYYPIL